MQHIVHTGIIAAGGIAAKRFLNQVPHSPIIATIAVTALSAYNRPNKGRFEGVKFAGAPLGKLLPAMADGLSAFLLVKIGRHIVNHKGFEHILKHKLALGGLLATTLFQVWDSRAGKNN